MLTQERLRELVAYDPETGVMTWRESTSARVKAGARVGNVNQGYRHTSILGERWKVSRLAWFYVTGERPAVEVDHHNHDTLDDRFTNLRLATGTQNVCNTRKRSDNTSGVKGVSWSKTNRSWCAELRLHGRRVYQKYFATVDEAATAITAARAKYHGAFACHA